ncbi:hypothetical protein [Microbacterium excoecariae]|uniref:hypothetical protein n=1 Tax=Microbacterium excoecariae TaxID=2715210 RepID=UPI001407E163|nr:hypothetical protein [Microbacterium excoecariae]NHI16851.1 hypothetical protein [Microbacterium excoecariae]
MSEARMVTFRQATKLVRRDVRTLHRWRVAGMETSFDDRGRRVVREDELRRHQRAHLRANPIVRQRLRHAESA